jgi:hypothetical protein
MPLAAARTLTEGRAFALDPRRQVHRLLQSGLLRQFNAASLRRFNEFQAIDDRAKGGGHFSQLSREGLRCHDRGGCASQRRNVHIRRMRRRYARRMSPEIEVTGGSLRSLNRSNPSDFALRRSPRRAAFGARIPNVRASRKGHSGVAHRSGPEPLGIDSWQSPQQHQAQTRREQSIRNLADCDMPWADRGLHFTLI